ncbi:MAG: AsnC family transcriptional regulator [Candidatus Parvarchaeota archaeon]
MDYRDFIILTEIMMEPFETYEKIGAKVGMSGVSIRNRILRMEDTGFLQGIYLIPSPIVFKKTVSTFVFPKVRDTALRLPKIVSVEDVVFAWIDHENDIVVTVYYKSEEDRMRSLDRLSDVLGRTPTAIFTPSSLLPPALSDSGLSSIDLKLLEHLVSDPRISISELSRKTNLTVKTIVNHRNSQMTKNKSILFHCQILPEVQVIYSTGQLPTLNLRRHLNN